MIIDSDPAVAVVQLNDALEDIEKELGINPSGVYADTRVRLDILEARINNPLAPAPNVENPFFIGNDGITISTGLGSPTEDRLDGSLYLRQDGLINEGLYARRGGDWELINTDPWIADGDLDGTYLSQTVVGIQNRPVSSTAPEDGYSIAWNDSLSTWEPQSVFTADNDLSGDKLSQTVVGIQNRPVSSGLPLNNDVLIWNNTQWEPQPSPIVFDGNNLRANKSDTTIDNSKYGIINLGNDSSALDGYLTITGGYQNTSNYHFSFIGGGASNNISAPASYDENDGYNIIVGGAQNTLSEQSFSNILGGSSNTIQSTPTNLCSLNNIIGGIDNTIENSYCSSILSSQSSDITGSYSSIINGNNNSISSDHSSIVSGYNNSILSGGTKNVIVSGNDSTIDGSNNSSIVNGSNNSINLSSNSVIVSGTNNSITSNLSSILNASVGLINSDNSTIISGSTQSLNVGSDNSIILSGNNNQSNSPFSILGGAYNTISGTSEMSFVYGDNNTLNSVEYSKVFGHHNNISGESSLIFGSNTYLKGSFSYGFGSYNNIGSVSNTVNHSLTHGLYAKSNYSGQYVHSFGSLSDSPGKSQYSRVILDGAGSAGSQFSLSSLGTYLVLEDGKSYDINIRVLIVNTNGTPTCARYIYDILVHQESGSLVIDNFNETLLNPNNTGWTVTINSASNQINVIIDSSGSLDRRAVATVEWRELSRN